MNLVIKGVVKLANQYRPVEAPDQWNGHLNHCGVQEKFSRWDNLFYQAISR